MFKSIKKDLKTQTKRFNKLKFGQKATVVAGIFAVFFFTLLAFGSIFLQKSLRDSQDLRKAASIPAGVVEITSLAEGNVDDLGNFIAGEEASVVFQVNTHDYQVNGIQLGFDVLGTFVVPGVPIAIETSNTEIQSLNLAAHVVTPINGGYHVEVILIPNQTAQPFSTSNPASFLRMTFTPDIDQDITVHFDPNVSIATQYQTETDILSTIHQMTFKVGKDPIVPVCEAPQNLTATSLSCNENEQLTAVLTWFPIPSATQYIIEYTQDPDFETGINVDITNSTTYSITNVADGIWYARVRADEADECITDSVNYFYATTVFSQDCTDDTPECTYGFGEWTSCSDGWQTRDYSVQPDTQPPTCPEPSDNNLRQPCTTQCQYIYSDWNNCTNDWQSRTYSIAPDGCTWHDNIILEELVQSCDSGDEVVPQCEYDYSEWSTCANNWQERTYSISPSECTWHESRTIENLVQSCDSGDDDDGDDEVAPQCEYTYSDWDTCTNDWQNRTYSISPSECTWHESRTIENLVQSCDSGDNGDDDNIVYSDPTYLHVYNYEACWYGDSDGISTYFYWNNEEFPNASRLEISRYNDFREIASKNEGDIYNWNGYYIVDGTGLRWNNSGQDFYFSPGVVYYARVFNGTAYTQVSVFSMPQCSGTGGVTYRQCDESCSNSSQCAPDLGCFNGVCRLAVNPESNICARPADNGLNRTCNEYCADTTECASGYSCWWNRCRLPDNLEDTNCRLPVAPVYNHGYYTPIYTQPVYANPTYIAPVYSTPIYTTPIYSTPVYSTPVYTTKGAPVILPAGCNEYCSSNNGCGPNHRCYENQCRHAVNPESAVCDPYGIVDGKGGDDGSGNISDSNAGGSITNKPSTSPTIDQNINGTDGDDFGNTDKLTPTKSPSKPLEEQTAWDAIKEYFGNIFGLNTESGSNSDDSSGSTNGFKNNTTDEPKNIILFVGIGLLLLGIIIAIIKAVFGGNKPKAGTKSSFSKPYSPSTTGSSVPPTTKLATTAKPVTTTKTSNTAIKPAYKPTTYKPPVYSPKPMSTLNPVATTKSVAVAPKPPTSTTPPGSSMMNKVQQKGIKTPG